ncbi:MAG: DUF5801 repeats-in-toxin domain-containing protein, partial [Notoacmeibacter sp.]
DDDVVAPLNQYLGRVTTAIGNGGLSSLFNVVMDAGSDKLQSQTGTLSFKGLVIGSSTGVATNLQATSGGAISLFQTASTLIEGRDAGGQIVFTLEIVAGQLQTTLIKAIRHTDANLHDSEIALSLSATTALPIQLEYKVVVVDKDNDSITRSATIDVITKTGSIISFDDDGPRLVSVQNASITVDEDDIDTAWSEGTSPGDGSGDGSLTDGDTGAAIASGSVAALVDFGQDGPAATNPYGFSATALADMAALGLMSKHNGLETPGIPLAYSIVSGSGNTIILRAVEPDTNSSVLINTGNPVFDFVLNTSSGAFEFRLFDELVHVSGNGQNTALLQSLTGGTGTLAAIDFGKIIIATDRDGDIVKLDGKVNVTVTDDVPDAELEYDDGSVTIDETAGQQNDDTTSSSIAALFNGVTNAGNDLDVSADPINYAVSDNDEVVEYETDVGADAPAAVRTLSLQINGPAASGLFLTDGTAINLYQEGNLIVGRAGTQAAVAAFAIAIRQDGNVAIAQYLSLRHGNSNDADDVVSLANKINAVLTVTDSDGDTSTDTLPIGSRLRFEDDGPDADDDTAAALGTATIIINVLSNDSFGSDGRAISNAVILTDQADNGTASFNTGTSQFSYTSNASFEGTDRFEYRLTDGDGDTSNATVTVKVDKAFAPTITTNLQGNQLIVKEDSSAIGRITIAAQGDDRVQAVSVAGLSTNASYTFRASSNGGTSWASVTRDGTTGALNLGVLANTSANLIVEVTVTSTLDDSDVDLGSLAFTATVKDADTALIASATANLAVVVDAVLDDYADVNQSAAASGTESATAQAISLGLTLALTATNPALAGFAAQPADGTTGDTTESVAVTIVVTGDVAQLQLSNVALGTLVETATPGTWTLTASKANLAAAVAAVQANVPAGFEGIITGSITATSTDTPTGGADVEIVTIDNTKADTATWSLNIAEGRVAPTLNLSLEQLTIKEDSSNTFVVTANAGSASDGLTA